MQFESVTTASNATGPSHASIFTSLYPKDHGVYGNAERLGSPARPLAEIFREEGYATGAFVGSLVLKSTLSGLGQGFDRYLDAGDAMKRGADEVNADALPWIREHADSRFFAWIHYMDPHTPYDPPELDRERYAPGGGDEDVVPVPEGVPFSGFRAYPRDLRWPEALYRGEISHMDRELGRLLAELDRSGLRERTILAFTADHGESLGEHGIYYKHVGLYGTTANVPWMLRGPGIEAMGERVSRGVETIDVAPTVLAAAGLEVPSTMRGTDRRAAARNGDPDPQYVQHSAGLALGLREGRYHAIQRLRKMRYGQRIVDPGFELYDLDRDPGMQSDRSGEEPGAVLRLEREMARWLRDRRPIESSSAELSEAERSALERLGYVVGDDE